jgi:hypothetical protein
LPPLLLLLLMMIYIHSISSWTRNCSYSTAIIPCCSCCIAHILLLRQIRQHL